MNMLRNAAGKKGNPGWSPPEASTATRRAKAPAPFRLRVPTRGMLMVGLLALVSRLTVAAPPPELSPQALAEIQALLQEKASWTPGQGKMESQLIHGSKRKRGVAFAAGAPSVKLDL